METRFACGCAITRNTEGVLMSAIPCEAHAPIGQGQPLVDALELPHIAVEVKEKLNVKSIFGNNS